MARPVTPDRTLSPAIGPPTLGPPIRRPSTLGPPIPAGPIHPRAGLA